ncbi:suppressor of fused domain protein [Paenarthrobacter ilicis]|uniref:suppressor of fused domain protein n=1 Tax=Paenarthrobacter ilicis TaxID=43665 RepID=UPI0028D4FE4B|nr:suppressor of fused domain protein [Paenarthrobacter ilicis]
MHESVGSYLLARWGEPTGRIRYEVDGLSIQVWKWNAEATGEGVDTYVTVGAVSGPSSEPGRVTHRAEFLLGLRPGQDAVASPFAALALYGRRNGVLVADGHTIPSDGPLWPGTEMMAFLVRNQETVIPSVQLSDGSHVHFLQAIPLYECELLYKRRHGMDALMGHWEERLVPFWDSEREPDVPEL